MQKLFLILLLFSNLFIISCDDNNPDELRILILSSDEYLFIDSVDITGDFTIQLYKEIKQKDIISNGFNQFLVAVYDYNTNNFSTNVAIELKVSFKNQNIISPSYVNDGITLEYLYQVDTYLGKSEIENDPFLFDFKLNINGRQRTALITLEDYVPSFDISQYFYVNDKLHQITLLRPIPAEIGFNEIVFSVHKLEESSFAEVTNLDFTFELSQNDNPITDRISDPILINSLRGIYSGSLILPEAGNYNLKVNALDNSTTVSSVDFNLSTKF